MESGGPAPLGGPVETDTAGLASPAFSRDEGSGFLCETFHTKRGQHTRVHSAPLCRWVHTRCVPACAVSVRWLGSPVTSGADGAADAGQPAGAGWAQVPTWQLCGQGEPVSRLEAGVMASSSGGCEDSVSEAGARI